MEYDSEDNGPVLYFMNDNKEPVIQLVKEKFLRRSLIKFGYKTINVSYITNIPLEKTLEQLENELLNFENEDEKKLYILTRLFTRINKNINNEKTAFNYFPFLFCNIELRDFYIEA